MKRLPWIIVALLPFALPWCPLASSQATAGDNSRAADGINLTDLDSPIVLRGDENTAYRDPTAVFHDGVFYLYVTMIQTEEENRIYSYTALSRSSNLRDWSKPVIITPKGQRLNYSSPGNVIRYGDEWIICLQSYPRPDYKRGGEIRWGDQTARLFIMRSTDLVHWSSPELLRVKGPEVPVEGMGRMIDPYLIEDKDEPGKWWCFYKQNGVSMSWSSDLKHWNFLGSTESGENVCVLVDHDEYVLIHSPRNGMGIKRSKDLKHWRDVGEVITLGQKSWPWTEARLTAGFVLDLRDEPRVGKYIMFFHGSGPGKNRTQDNVDANCCVGIAWSDDLKTWQWPAPAGQTGSDGFVSLFDGRSLDGWHAVPKESASDWTVRDGAIVGHGSADRLAYLVWKEQHLADFELELRYPGFSGKDVTEYQAVDDLRLKPAWRDNKDLSALKGKAVRIRFRLRNARLYAFQIQ